MFANDRAFNLIDNLFEVDNDAPVPVHAIMKVWFKGKRPKVCYDAVKLPGRLLNLVNEVCVKMFSQETLIMLSLKDSGRTS